MSKNTFKPGDRVKVLSTPRTEALGIVGRRFTVGEVEPDDYTGPLAVRVSNGDVEHFWLSREAIKLRSEKEKKPLKLGDKVIVKVQPNDSHFPVGVLGTVTRIDKDSPEYTVEALDDYWFYTREQLKRAKKEKPRDRLPPAPAAKRDIEAELEAAWPWPKGTPVSFSKTGPYPQLAYMPGCTLGSDGSSAPPVLDADGKYVRYVDASCVTLRTEYKTWGETSSRIVSDLTEKQRTGPMRAALRPGSVAIRHSKDGEGEPSYWLYKEGDYRDNGDGTGTVLTLEEIFLNGLTK